MLGVAGELCQILGCRQRFCSSHGLRASSGAERSQVARHAVDANRAKDVGVTLVVLPDSLARDSETVVP